MGDDAKLGMDAGICGICGMDDASCFHASRVGVDGTAAG